MYGADPRHLRYGTKSGRRALFAAAGVPHPLGVEDITSVGATVLALRRVRAARPGPEEALLKLNDGVGGKGNALIDLRGLPAAGSPELHLLDERHGLTPPRQRKEIALAPALLRRYVGAYRRWVDGKVRRRRS